MESKDKFTFNQEVMGRVIDPCQIIRYQDWSMGD